MPVKSIKKNYQRLVEIAEEFKEANFDYDITNRLIEEIADLKDTIARYPSDDRTFSPLKKAKKLLKRIIDDNEIFPY